MKLSRKTLRKMILKEVHILSEMWDEDGNWHDGTRWIMADELKRRDRETALRRLSGEEGRRRAQLGRFWKVIKKAYNTPVTMDTIVFAEDVRERYHGGYYESGYFYLCKSVNYQPHPKFGPEFMNEFMTRRHGRIIIADLSIKLPRGEQSIMAHIKINYETSLLGGKPLGELIDYLRGQEYGGELADKILSQVEEYNKKYGHEGYDPCPQGTRSWIDGKHDYEPDWVPEIMRRL